MHKLPWILTGVLASLLVGCGGSGDEGESEKEAGPEFPPTKTATYKGEKVPLRILFKPGRYRMIEQMSQKMTITIRAEGRTQPVDQNTEMEALGDVVIDPPNAAGERRVVYTCTKVKMSMDAMGRTLRFDSADRYGGSRELRFLRTLVGRKLEQVYSRDGKFLRMDGLETILSQMSAAAGGQAQMEKMRKMLVPMFKEILTRHWGKLIPTKPIGPGDTWRCTADLNQVPILGKLDTHFACRLQDIETPATGPVAVIAGNVLAETYFARPSAGESPFPENVDVEIKELRMNGPMVFHFDTDIGLSTALESRLDITGEMKITVEQRGQSHEAEATLGGSVHIQAALLREGDTRQSPPKLLADAPRRRRPSRYAEPAEVAPPAPRAAEATAYPRPARARRAYSEPVERAATTAPAPPRPIARPVPPTLRTAQPARAPRTIAARSDRAKITAAKTDLATLSIALDTYEVEVSRYPTTSQGLRALLVAPAGVRGWHGPYLKRGVPKDPWGHGYRYLYPAQHNREGYDLWSLGPDGVSGSKDDITNW